MKKVLSIMLSLVMAVTSLTMATSVFAKDAKTAKVTFSVYDAGFKLAPTALTVSADMSDSYSAGVGYNNPAETDGVTVLDAILTASLEIFGEDFMTTAPLKLQESQYGWGIVSSFGKNTQSIIYRVNGGWAMGVDDVLKDGDIVEYYIYQGSSDLYVYPEKREYNELVGNSVELKFTVEGYDESYNYFTAPASGLDVIVDGIKVGTTDENGAFTYKVTEIGSRMVYLRSSSEDYLILPSWCTINSTTNLLEYVKKQEAAAGDYLFASKTEFGVGDSYSLVTLIRSGYDAGKFAEKYAASVKANLDANGGKIISPDSNQEDLGLYGAVIICLEELGYDITDFFSYDIEEAFNNADIEDARPHQYNYKYAIETAEPAKAKSLIDDLIGNYYVKGKGMMNWGFSCDNACHFLISIAPYSGDYMEYVEDAENVIKSYLLKDGAYCDPVWSSKANGDSTALSMAAFASVDDIKTAFSYYKLLCENFEPSTGKFAFELNGKENNLATKDALFSLYYFKNAVYFNNYEHPEHINTVIKGTPATFKAAGKTDGAVCKICGLTVAQKSIAKLGAAKLSKVKKGKKSFVATWKKVDGVDGYEIQYSTTKKFKKKVKGKKQVLKKKIVNNANTTKKKVKKLKSKKTYFVRIRAYKTINGKKQYSAWSKAKKVKTK